jgi:hypothetical protein
MEKEHALREVELSPESIQQVIDHLYSLNEFKRPQRSYIDTNGNIYVEEGKINFEILPKEGSNPVFYAEPEKIVVKDKEFFAEITLGNIDVLRDSRRYKRCFSDIISHLRRFIFETEHPLAQEINEIDLKDKMPDPS